jgi:hypothetical protein
MNELDRSLDLLESCAHKITATVVVNNLKHDSDLAPCATTRGTKPCSLAKKMGWRRLRLCKKAS